MGITHRGFELSPSDEGDRLEANRTDFAAALSRAFEIDASPGSEHGGSDPRVAVPVLRERRQEDSLAAERQRQRLHELVVDLERAVARARRSLEAHQFSHSDDVHQDLREATADVQRKLARLLSA